MRTGWARAGLVVAVALTVVGCGSDVDTADPGPNSSGSAVTDTVTVFAAASLTGTFTQIGKDFESAHPGTTVAFAGHVLSPDAGRALLANAGFQAP